MREPWRDMFCQATRSLATADAAPEHLRRHFAPQWRTFLVQRLGFGSDPEVVTGDNPTQLLRELSVDLVVKQGGALRAFQIKATAAPALARQAASTLTAMPRRLASFRNQPARSHH